MTIKPNATLVKQTCRECGVECKIIMIPLCNECIDRLLAGEKIAWANGWATAASPPPRA